VVLGVLEKLPFGVMSNPAIWQLELKNLKRTKIFAKLAHF
jgi:hypothetical protein